MPDLALLTLTNARGQTLFSGLRHGFTQLPELDGRLLMGLPSTVQSLGYGLHFQGDEVSLFLNAVANKLNCIFNITPAPLNAVMAA